VILLLSACRSVCDVEVSWSHRLEYFEIIAWLIILLVERQSARMSKIANDGLTRPDTGYFIAVPIMATVGVKGLKGLCFDGVRREASEVHWS